MLAFLQLLGTCVANLFRSKRRLEVENLFLRHQLNIALRSAPHRQRLRGSDRALLVWMTWLWPSLLGLSRIVQPDTILRWHRAGFRTYWRWKSRGRPGVGGRRLLLQRLRKVPPHLGELTRARFELLFQLAQRIGPVANARFRLRSGRTKLGGARWTSCTFARQGHLVRTVTGPLCAHRRLRTAQESYSP